MNYYKIELKVFLKLINMRGYGMLFNFVNEGDYKFSIFINEFVLNKIGLCFCNKCV